MKPKEVTFYDDHYEVSINFLHGGTADDFIDLIKSRHKEAPLYSWGKKFEFGEDGNTTDAYQFHVNAVHGDGEKFYLWMLHTSNKLMYHEIFHLTGDILYRSGIRYCEESEEIYAYYGAWLFNKICTLIKWKPKYS